MANQKPGDLARDDYTYSTQPVAIAAGQSVVQALNIEAGSDFEILKRMAYNGKADLNPALLTVQITDTGSGRDLFNTPAILSNVFGTAQLPYIMQQTKIFSARSTISITITNIGGDNYENVQLSFGGRKIFGARQY